MCLSAAEMRQPYGPAELQMVAIVDRHLTEQGQENGEAVTLWLAKK